MLLIFFLLGSIVFECVGRVDWLVLVCLGWWVFLGGGTVLHVFMIGLLSSLKHCFN